MMNASPGIDPESGAGDQAGIATGSPSSLPARLFLHILRCLIGEAVSHREAHRASTLAHDYISAVATGHRHRFWSIDARHDQTHSVSRKSFPTNSNVSPRSANGAINCRTICDRTRSGLRTACAP